jgi:hypothetical protein
MKEKDVRGMIDDCLNVLHIPKSRGGPSFSEWEVKFIDSIHSQFNRNMGLYNCHGLSDRQIEKLESIWNKI